MIQSFMKKETSSGILLMITTVLALLCSNSLLSPYYQSFLHIPIAIQIGALHLEHSLYHWVNDGLMAVFFFLIGLEVKREAMVGQLASFKSVVLPGIAAVGGMLVPALVYVACNAGDAVAMKGWAIPTPTDIAFALAVLSLLGNRVPTSLKIFLMALAIMDDLGAIIIIALFYSTDLSTLSLWIAGISLATLVLLNYFHVTRRAVYIVIGIILWVSVLKSGVHATLAGVALAFTIPLYGKDKSKPSPLKSLEHDIHPWVAFVILPLFAFVNAGVDMRNISLEQLANPVPLGILLGLFVGKQVGVFVLSWLAIQLKWAKLPEGANWVHFYGVSVLTGIGFTMSLFITSLAFEDDTLFQYTDKLAILLASLLSGILGYAVLKYTNSNNV